jgi:hypothetical protein
MRHAGDDFLSREGIEDHDWLASMGRQAEAIVVDSLDGQGQFFGAVFGGRF